MNARAIFLLFKQSYVAFLRKQTREAIAATDEPLRRGSRLPEPKYSCKKEYGDKTLLCVQREGQVCASVILGL
jgi:hypothetical protein